MNENWISIYQFDSKKIQSLQVSAGKFRMFKHPCASRKIMTSRWSTDQHKLVVGQAMLQCPLNFSNKKEKRSEGYNFGHHPFSVCKGTPTVFPNACRLIPNVRCGHIVASGMGFTFEFLQIIT